MTPAEAVRFKSEERRSQEFAQRESRMASQFNQTLNRLATSKDKNVSAIELSIQRATGTPEQQAAAQAAIDVYRQNFQAPTLDRDVAAITSGDPEEMAKGYARLGAREAARSGVVKAETSARVGETPLTDAAQQRIQGLLDAKRIVTGLKSKYTDEERARFVGILKNPVQRIKQFVVSDPRFAEFQADVNIAKSFAFGPAGKQLTVLEAKVVWGFTPTGTETSIADFAAKLNANLTRTDFLLDVEKTLNLTPRRLLEESIKKISESAEAGSDIPKDPDEQRQLVDDLLKQK